MFAVWGALWLLVACTADSPAPTGVAEQPDAAPPAQADDDGSADAPAVPATPTPEPTPTPDPAVDWLALTTSWEIEAYGLVDAGSMVVESSSDTENGTCQILVGVAQAVAVPFGGFPVDLDVPQFALGRSDDDPIRLGGFQCNTSVAEEAGFAWIGDAPKYPQGSLVPFYATFFVPEDDQVTSLKLLGPDPAGAPGPTLAVTDRELDVPLVRLDRFPSAPQLTIPKPELRQLPLSGSRIEQAPLGTLAEGTQWTLELAGMMEQPTVDGPGTCYLIMGTLRADEIRNNNAAFRPEFTLRRGIEQSEVSSEGWCDLTEAEQAGYGSLIWGVMQQGQAYPFVNAVRLADGATPEFIALTLPSTNERFYFGVELVGSIPAIPDIGAPRDQQLVVQSKLVPSVVELAAGEFQYFDGPVTGQSSPQEVQPGSVPWVVEQSTWEIEPIGFLDGGLTQDGNRCWVALGFATLTEMTTPDTLFGDAPHFELLDDDLDFVGEPLPGCADPRVRISDYNLFADGSAFNLNLRVPFYVDFVAPEDTNVFGLAIVRPGDDESIAVPVPVIKPRG